MISKDWTLSALSVELAMDRRALARSLEGLKPDNETKVGKRMDRTYKMARVVAHIYQHGDVLDLSHERAKLTVLQQQKIELEIAELRGELIRVSAVEEQWSDQLAAMRAKLLALPSKIAISIAQPDRIQATQDKTRALIYEALSELSGNANDQLERSDDASVDGTQTTVGDDDIPMGGTELDAESGGFGGAGKISH